MAGPAKPGKPAGKPAGKQAGKPTDKPAEAHHSPPSNDNWVLIVAVVVLASLFGGLVAWSVLRPQTGVAATPQSFTKMSTVRFAAADFTVRVQFSLQSGEQDNDWMKQNKKHIQAVIEAALLEQKPEDLVAVGPQKIIDMQNRLTERVREKFPDANVDQILFTEFLTSHDTQY